MNNFAEKIDEFIVLLARHTPAEGLNETSIPQLATYKESQPHGRHTVVYEPGIAILGQGTKACYLDGKKYDYSAGNYLSLLLPLPVEVEAVAATSEKPLLMAGIRIDLIRLGNILLKMDRAGGLPPATESPETSAIFAKPLSDDLLEPVIKLLHTLDDPLERAILADVILDEIYFRLILNDHSGSLQILLQHRGQVQQISKAVDHIHHNLDEVVSVDRLASMVNMSASGFRKTFREVMHMPPLQYAKAIKLDRAQTLIREGKNASEAGYLVGYNSPAQFSREYKRYFGYSPSATLPVPA
jgi:AraC-like DNA-binding protein